jgi:SAM-dependent methyltransferase
MQPRLYGDLVPWYDLLDPVADHLDEATAYQEILERAATPRPGTLLELGAGAGNNAFFFKRRFRCVLTDLSEAMLGLSRAQNPECEHRSGDMRTLRLGRTFDTVMVHDAVGYMTAIDDLRAAAETAFVHTRPGGAAVFAPDYVREAFREHSALHAGQEGTRALRCLEWAWDPDPSDDRYAVDYAFLLRDGSAMTAVHDHHVEGLFTHATWQAVLQGVGYHVETLPRPFEDLETGTIFVCRRL